MEIEINGKSYYINKLMNEPDIQFIQRARFIVKCHSNPKNTYSLTEIKKYSKIWTNIEFLQCSYDKIIMDKIIKMKTLC